jgi:MerR family transcriptional regulator, redox-sensitive transcriptional activator SoxR
MVGLKVSFKSRGSMKELTMEKELSIGEMATRAGVKSSTLRYYESIGLLPAAKRISGQRRYREDTLQLLRVLQLAQNAGFTLAEMQMLVHGFAPGTPPAARWQELASKKLIELDTQLERIKHMQGILNTALACGCLRLEDCAPMNAGELCQS